jgi:hypothetical protein
MNRIGRRTIMCMLLIAALRADLLDASVMTGAAN